MALDSKFLRPSQTNEADPTAADRYRAAIKAELAAARAAGDTARAAELERALEGGDVAPAETTAVEPATRKAVAAEPRRTKK